MKYILAIFLLSLTSVYASASEEKKQDSKTNHATKGTKHPTAEEWKKRNDTSKYQTNIGHNPTY